MSRALEIKGFHIQYISYLDGRLNSAAEFTINDGRELLGVIAKK